MTRRCSTCGISYPWSWTAKGCEVCGGKTDSINDTPDADWQEKVRLMKAVEEKVGIAGEMDDTVRWRFAQLLRAEFSPREAEELAWNRHIDLHQAVAFATNPRCGPTLAYKILT